MVENLRPIFCRAVCEQGLALRLRDIESQIIFCELKKLKREKSAIQLALPKLFKFTDRLVRNALLDDALEGANVVLSPKFMEALIQIDMSADRRPLFTKPSTLARKAGHADTDTDANGG